ncbi:MAG: PhnD/SsuA/transferrin family substrate-binding protein [Anaerolineae bacterium]|nr:PhnD/SsuA/transferrin family substrate-binding protein [Anaerolineae bacterium]
MTPTPRSTALPLAADAPTLGDPERPISINFVIPEDDRDSNVIGAKNDLEAYLEDQLDLTVNVGFLENDSEAIKDVCSGRPTAVWASPFSLVAAEQTCGAVPGLSITRGRSTRETIGTTIEIVAHTDISSLSILSGWIFCRIDAQDVDSWVFPSLLMASEGVNPFIDLGGVQDYPDNEAMLLAIYNGECAAAGMPPGEFDTLVDTLASELTTGENPVTRDDIRNIMCVIRPAADVAFPGNMEAWQGYGRNMIPYEGLIFPPDSALPPALREQIAESILDFADSSQGEGLLRDVLDASQIIKVLPDASNNYADYYAAFRSTVIQAKWDMTFSE